jgi:hypothetical protein
VSQRAKLYVLTFFKLFLLYAAVVIFGILVIGVGIAWDDKENFVRNVTVAFELFWPFIIPAALIISAVQLFASFR